MIKGFKLLILSLAIVDVGQAKGMVGAGGCSSQDGARAVWDSLYEMAEKNAKKPPFVCNWISSYKNSLRLFSFYICPYKSTPKSKAWHVAPIIISLEEQDRLPLETKNFYISMKEYCFSQGSSLSTGSIEGGVYVSAFNEEYERYIKRLEYFKRVEQDFIAKQAAKASQAGALQCNFAGEHPANRIACTIPDEAPRITRYDLAHTEEFKKWVYDTKPRGWDHTEKLEQFLVEYNKIKQ